LLNKEKPQVTVVHAGTVALVGPPANVEKATKMQKNLSSKEM
jgi:hypothetical protein